ncbi:MAG: F0F1 ATP synthase subunit B [Verrucomicrobiales bacterium]|nr:F0F1 ATP synthase subunit B [Verrucomicrobiales bacterium]
MEVNALFAAAAAEGGGLIGNTAAQFGVNWQLFISQVISFCLVAFLLHRFAYKPILKVLEERRQQIADGLANAEKIKVQLAEAEAARREMLQKANVDANRLIEEARAAAAKVQEQESQRAVAQAEQIIAKAREAAQADYEKMKQDLRKEMGRLAVDLAARVSGKILTVDDQRRLAEDTNKQLVA